MYFVRCACGKEKSVRGYSMTGGNTKSCGCIKQEKAMRRLPSLDSMKVCIACRKSKKLTDFHVHKKMADGRIGKCKECCIAYAKAYKNAHPESAKRNHQRWARTDHGKKKLRELAERFPERESARRAVAAAILKGLLVRQPCFICGAKGQAHHPDYSAPLDVTWLCSSHHSEAHQMMKRITQESNRKTEG